MNVGGFARAALSLAALTALATAAAACGGSAFAPGDASAEAEEGDAADASIVPDASARDADAGADVTMVDVVEEGVACKGTSTSCGPSGGPCVDCTAGSAGLLCYRGACVCNGPSDCPPGTACRGAGPSSGCSAACANSVGGCNGGCCDPTSGCVAACTTGCCDTAPAPPAPAFPTCVAGDTDLACGSAGDCKDCQISTGTRYCVSRSCVACRSAADCPPLQACSSSTHQCSATGCNASVDGCNGGFCDMANGACVAACTGGCSVTTPYPACVAGTGDDACGLGGGACTNCTICLPTSMGGKVCVGGKCGCSAFTDCCVAAATCTSGVCSP